MCFGKGSHDRAFTRQRRCRGQCESKLSRCRSLRTSVTSVLKEEIEDRISGRPRKTVVDAIDAFHAQHNSNTVETNRKYKRIPNYLLQFCNKESIHFVDRIDVDPMDRYALWRAKGGWAWIKEIEHPSRETLTVACALTRSRERRKIAKRV